MISNILLVEDESAIAENVIYALKAEGMQVHWCKLGADGLLKLEQTAIDLIILDVGLPDINGFELCKQIRKFSDVAIIFLTARSDEIDRVVGLEIGADDYVIKPFSLRELVARVKVILRRQQLTNNAFESAPNKSEKLTRLASPFQVDDVKRQISYLGNSLTLTVYEFGILQLLLKQPERVYTREQLMEVVWSTHQESYDRAVDGHIKSLRAKLRVINQDDQSLVTHRGVGYSIKLATS